jgi:hypothetical protein
MEFVMDKSILTDPSPYVKARRIPRLKALGKGGAMTPYQPSADTARLISYLHRGGTWGYWHFLPARSTIWYPSGAPCDVRVPPGQNLYFGVNPTSAIPTHNASGKPARPSAVRGQKSYIQAVNCLFADFDSKYFDNDLVAIIRHIKRLPVAPSVQICSGNGIHAYWLLTDTFVIEGDESRNLIDHVQKAWVRRVYGDDARKDLTSVLRVPDTFSVKYTPPRLVFFVERDFERTYALNELASHVAPPPKPRKPREIERKAMSSTADGATLDERTLALIEEFNRGTRIEDILQRYGYSFVGDRMLSPYSTSNSPGVVIFENNKVFIHHGSDPLFNGGIRPHPRSPFDVLKYYEYHDSFADAIESLRRAA